LKRIPALKPLSMDHHLGLVLAIKAKKTATQDLSSDEQQAVWTALLAHAEDVLLSHFDIEESYLATALSKCGDPHLDQLVERLYQEHASLRSLLSPDSDRNATNLQSLGELLEQHIRFEERELFEAAQTALDDDTLQAIAAVCKTRHNR